MTTLLIVPALVGSIALAKFGQVDNPMKEKILSKDFKIAQDALEENKKQKNIQAICMSLKHQSLQRVSFE